MNRQDQINKIIKYSTRFTEELRYFNSLSLYNINIHSENFILPVLNLVFNVELKNLNTTEKKNFPSIDLADFSRRIAFQITSTSTSDKVISTVEKFSNHKLFNYISSLYILILGERANSYPQRRVDEISKGSFTFNCGDNILDINDLIRLINDLPIEKLEKVCELFELEFSDVKIETRKKKFKYRHLIHEPEQVFLNVLKINFPKQLFIADLEIDEEEILERKNQWRVQQGHKPLKKFRYKNQILTEELRYRKIYSKDWVQTEGKIVTFRNLYDNRVPYSELIDKGTITPMACEEYYSNNEDNMRVFKHLLRNTLIQDCYKIGLEWEPSKEVLRFKADRMNPQSKSVVWKGKKTATKTVISEIYNKDGSHLVCYRHLAFKPSFDWIGNEWLMCVNSTWSFTNPSAHYKSRFESSYLSGIKRLENNNTVCYFFKFWSYFLQYQDLLTSSDQQITFTHFKPLLIVPKIDDSNWLPVRVNESQTIVNESIISLDNDLFLNLFENED